MVLSWDWGQDVGCICSHEKAWLGLGFPMIHSHDCGRRLLPHHLDVSMGPLTWASSQTWCPIPPEWVIQDGSCNAFYDQLSKSIYIITFELLTALVSVACFTNDYLHLKSKRISHRSLVFPHVLQARHKLPFALGYIFKNMCLVNILGKQSISKAKRRHWWSKEQAPLLLSLTNVGSLHSKGKASLIPIIKNYGSLNSGFLSSKATHCVCRFLLGPIHVDVLGTRARRNGWTYADAHRNCYAE